MNKGHRLVSNLPQTPHCIHHLYTKYTSLAPSPTLKAIPPSHSQGPHQKHNLPKSISISTIIHLLIPIYLPISKIISHQSSPCHLSVTLSLTVTTPRNAPQDATQELRGARPQEVSTTPHLKSASESPSKLHTPVTSFNSLPYRRFR